MRDFQDEYYDDDEGYEVSEETYNTVSFVSLLSTWFIRIMLVIAVILFAYFLFKGKVLTALLYVLGLILAYFFGYFFVYLLDFITSNN